VRAGSGAAGGAGGGVGAHRRAYGEPLARPLMPPARKVTPAAAEEDEEWAVQTTRGCSCNFSVPACCDANGLRQHWRLSFFVLGGAFVGLVVYLSINAYTVTQEESQTR
jgi:hypothetical protein